MPMCPCPVFILIVDKLEKVFWHAHLVGSDSRALGNIWHENRSGDHIEIAGRSCYVLPRRHLDRLGPDATVMLRCLRHHIGQRKALRHGLCRGHVTGRRQVTAVEATAFVIVQFSAFCRTQSCISEKPVAALFIGICHGGPVQPLGHKHGRFALARMQYGEGVVAKGTICRLWRKYRRFSVGKEPRAR
jgi:hypothetical protein